MIIRYTDECFEKAKSYDYLELECENCHRIFTAQKKSIKHEISHKRGRLKYCSIECHNLAMHRRHKVKCEECGKEIEITDSAFNKSKTKHFFCCSSCAAKFNNSKRDGLPEETKKKISVSLKKFNCNNHNVTNVNQKELEIKSRKKYDSSSRFIKRTCRICGKEYTLKDSGSTRVFCSKECSREYRENRKKYLSLDSIEKLSFAGRHSAETQSLTRRSKNEKYFFNLCENHFKSVKHNEPIFNGWDADIIIEDIRFGILWNGKWHYEKITEKHSLEQTQNRDKIKIGEIKKCGYTPYVIKDMGKYNPLFVENEFQKLLDYIHSGGVERISINHSGLITHEITC